MNSNKSVTNYYYYYYYYGVTLQNLSIDYMTFDIICYLFISLSACAKNFKNILIF